MYIAVTAEAVTGTAEPFLYELVTVAPYVANTWKGAEFRSEVWSLTVFNCSSGLPGPF